MLRHKHKSNQAQGDSCVIPPAFLCGGWPLQVHTIERSSGTLRVVGFGLLALFLDPRDGGQPLSRFISDYVLNSGAFQVPVCVCLCVCDRFVGRSDTPVTRCCCCRFGCSLRLRVSDDTQAHFHSSPCRLRHRCPCMLVRPRPTPRCA